MLAAKLRSSLACTGLLLLGTAGLALLEVGFRIAASP